MILTLIAVTTTNDTADLPVKERQRNDSSLCPLIDYLENRILPSDEKKVRVVLVGEDHYTLVDDILFRVVSDKSLHIIPPTADQKNMWEQLHSGYI